MGSPTGFTLNWDLPDWLVPAGAWTYQALTPIEALGRIVGAVGGTLLPHPSTKTLTACARYPTAPWEWAGATPAVSLPLDVVSTLDLRWQEKPTLQRRLRRWRDGRASSVAWSGPVPPATGWRRWWSMP